MNIIAGVRGQRIHVDRPLRAGDIVKVRIGDFDYVEWPWAIFLEPDSESGGWRGRIDNCPVYSDVHGIHAHDVVLFEPADDGDGPYWQGRAAR